LSHDKADIADHRPALEVATVRKPAQMGGFPANKVTQVREMIGPLSAESG
jgi:hypothetical protein